MAHVAAEWNVHFRVPALHPPRGERAERGDDGATSLDHDESLDERGQALLGPPSRPAPGFIENPVGRLATVWRPPDVAFDPCEFAGYLDPPGDLYTKRTCLWTFGGFRLPERRWHFPVEGSKMHKMSGSWEDERSETPMGFAEAVFASMG